MSEAGGQASPVDAATPVMTAGMLLRQAREAAGLHVAALAVALKVPVRKLEALETDRIDLLPDAVFARALASSVCRTLKIDPQPILLRLPQTPKPRLVQDRDGINTPFRGSGDATGTPWRDMLGRPVFLAVAALLLGALVLLLLPAIHMDLAEPAPRVQVPAQVLAPPAPAVAATGTTVPVSVPVSAPGPVPTLTKSSTVNVPSAVPEPLAAAPVATPEAAPSIVVFNARAPSWIEVTDARGAVALRKLLGPGETVGAAGPLPLQVTVGSARTTDVRVRGKALDLVPVSRDNVARFEVK